MSDNQKNGGSKANANSNEKKEPLDARRVLEKPRVFSEYLTWTFILGISLGLIGILVSAFCYEHIAKPKILWIAYLAFIGLLACVTKATIDYLESQSKVQGKKAVPATVPATQQTHPPATIPTTQTQSTQAHAASRPKPDSSTVQVSIRASSAMPRESMKPVSFMYTAAKDCTALYPIETALLIHIKNRGSHQLSIAEYSIECQTKGGAWETLPSFAIPHSGKLIGALDIHQATRIEIADPMLDAVISDSSIAPNATISGWAILGQVEHKLTRNFRMRIRDSEGNEFTEGITLPLDVRLQPSPEACMRFRIPEIGIDLSRVPIKQYFRFRA